MASRRRPDFHQVEIVGRLSPVDKQASAYMLLPFYVPPGIGRLEVAYRFSDDDPGGFLRQPKNVLDIGLFDPRGSEFLLAEGFRGWSGSARRDFFLSPKDATPGYLAGPIQPGQWGIILGLYRIVPWGCDYSITVRMYSGPSGETSPEPLKRLPTLRSAPGWYRGDLHAHTHHSDATGSLADLCDAARAQGLDFLAVTEHNTTSHLPHLRAYVDANLLLIPGMELTTERGHANTWGIRRWHEFRCEKWQQMAQVVADIQASGALISINHPKQGGPPWEFGGEKYFDCLEVWQAPWFAFNDQSLGLWHQLLREGHRLTAVGGSDVHQAPLAGDTTGLVVGRPCTWVYAEELSEVSVLAGIKAGHVFISEDPSGPRLLLWADAGREGGDRAIMGDQIRVSPGQSVRLCCQTEGAAGCLLRIRSSGSDLDLPIDEDRFRYEWLLRTDSDGWFRAEIWHHIGQEDAAVRALSNPIYLALC